MARSKEHSGIVYDLSDHVPDASTVAIALWVMTTDMTVLPKLQLVLDAVYEGGIGSVVTNNPKWSAAERD